MKPFCCGHWCGCRLDDVTVVTGTVESWRLGAQDYFSITSANFYADMAKVSASLGLAVTHKSAIAFASLVSWGGEDGWQNNILRFSERQWDHASCSNFLLLLTFCSYNSVANHASCSNFLLLLTFCSHNSVANWFIFVLNMVPFTLKVSCRFQLNTVSVVTCTNTVNPKHHSIFFTVYLGFAMVVETLAGGLDREICLWPKKQQHSKLGLLTSVNWQVVIVCM